MQSEATVSETASTENTTVDSNYNSSTALIANRKVLFNLCPCMLIIIVHSLDNCGLVFDFDHVDHESSSKFKHTTAGKPIM